MFVSGRIDLSEYDALELCIHGDGRPYIVNIQSPGLARKDDLWQIIMYTRGGVIWENIIVSAGFFPLVMYSIQDQLMLYSYRPFSVPAVTVLLPSISVPAVTVLQVSSHS